VALATNHTNPMTRLWHQSSIEIEDLDWFRNMLTEHANHVLGIGATIDIHGVPSGSYQGRAPSEALGNAFVHHRLLEPVLINAVHAERDGYDAFVIGSFSEPFLREVRSAVDIPVVSLTETSLLIGCSLGRYSAPVSNSPQIAWLTRMSIEAHGLSSRVLRVQAIDPPLDELELAEGFKKPAPVIDSFTLAAKRAIADGADVIIPAEGMLGELLYVNGVARIGLAPVLDVYGTTWSYALMLSRLRAMTGLEVGRCWQYRRDDPAFVRELAR
jgi:allantoin racemase